MLPGQGGGAARLDLVVPTAAASVQKRRHFPPPNCPSNPDQVSNVHVRLESSQGDIAAGVALTLTLTLTPTPTLTLTLTVALTVTLTPTLTPTLTLILPLTCLFEVAF